MAKGKPSQFGGPFFTHTPPSPERERGSAHPKFSAPNLRERGMARNDIKVPSVGAVELIALVVGGESLWAFIFEPV